MYKFLITIVFIGLLSCKSDKNTYKENDNQPDTGKYLRVATFNVAVGQFATAQEIATRLKPLNLDLLSLVECPEAIDKASTPDFAGIIARELGMGYIAAGSTSSGDHWSEWGVDVTGKYHGKLRMILSKTPLTGIKETTLTGKGWKNASVLNATTEIYGKPFSVYALHIPGCNGDINGSAMKDLTDHVLSEDTNQNILVMGDFNDVPGSPAMDYVFNAGFRSIWDDIKNPADKMDPFGYGIIDNILIKKASGLITVDAYSIFPASGKLSDHPYVWCKILIQCTSDS